MLALILVISTIIPSFASDNNRIDNGDLIIEYQFINNNSIIIAENNKKSLISQREHDNKIITTLKDLETGNEAYFVRDQIKGTIYSSITNKTINLDISNNEEKIGYLSSGDDILIARHEISYVTIVFLVGAAGGAAEIAAAALAYKGIPAGLGIALIVAVIVETGQITAGALVLMYPNGGLRYEEWWAVKYIQGLPEYRTVIRNAGHVAIL